MRLQNDRINVCLPRAMTEVATLQKALSEAEDKAAKERIEREKQEARVSDVPQELEDFMQKYESLERDSKTQEFELAKALQSVRDAKAEVQKEIQAAKKIAAGKEFIMQSKHVKETFFLLTRIWSSPGAFADLPRRRVLPSRRREINGEVVLVSVYWDRTPRGPERPAEAVGRTSQCVRIGHEGPYSPDVAW